MKTKITLGIVLLSITLLTGCRRASVLGEVGQCLEYATKYSEAALAFSSNETKGNCESMKKALETYIKKCDFTDAADKDELEDELDDYDCSQYN